ICPDSIATPLLGVAMKMLTFDEDVDYAQAGMNLVGMGVDLTGEVKADLLGGPPPEKRGESTTVGVKRVSGR
ncbi:MAG: hypothetical protein KJ749_10215, partial [Planctomycetes bacterium]|nr:hypothetical protein [Planctomycetota bacterium]